MKSSVSLVTGFFKGVILTSDTTLSWIDFGVNINRLGLIQDLFEDIGYGYGSSCLCFILG